MENRGCAFLSVDCWVGQYASLGAVRQTWRSPSHPELGVRVVGGARHREGQDGGELSGAASTVGGVREAPYLEGVWEDEGGRTMEGPLCSILRSVETRLLHVMLITRSMYINVCKLVVTCFNVYKCLQSRCHVFGMTSIRFVY
jgi:hypothetical protein